MRSLCHCVGAFSGGGELERPFSSSLLRVPRAASPDAGHRLQRGRLGSCSSWVELSRCMSLPGSGRFLTAWTTREVLSSDLVLTDEVNSITAALSAHLHHKRSAAVNPCDESVSSGSLSFTPCYGSAPEAMPFFQMASENRPWFRALTPVLGA